MCPAHWQRNISHFDVVKEAEKYSRNASKRSVWLKGFTSAVCTSLSLLFLRLQHVGNQVRHRRVVLACQEVFGLNQTLDQAVFKAHLEHSLHHRRQHGRRSSQTPNHVWWIKKWKTEIYIYHMMLARQPVLARWSLQHSIITAQKQNINSNN